jgi:hypothetical protein
LLKRLLCISLFVVCLLQSVGMSLIYQIQQFYANEEMEEQLIDSSTHLEKLCVSRNDFNKNKLNDRELFQNGKMYDFKLVGTFGDSVELAVINDVREENIVERKKDLVHRSKESNRLLNSLIQLLLLDFIENPQTTPSIFYRNATHSYPQFYAVVILRFSDTLSPPPWLS